MNYKIPYLYVYVSDISINGSNLILSITLTYIIKNGLIKWKNCLHNFH